MGLAVLWLVLRGRLSRRSRFPDPHHGDSIAATRPSAAELVVARGRRRKRRRWLSSVGLAASWPDSKITAPPASGGVTAPKCHHGCLHAEGWRALTAPSARKDPLAPEARSGDLIPENWTVLDWSFPR